jgi:DNA-binding Xre family transcriptional regulator
MSYMKLWHLLLDKHLTKKDLCRLAGVSTAVVAKLTKGRNVETDVLIKICTAMECNIADIMEIVDIESTAGQCD